MSYLNLPTSYDEDNEGMDQDNIANISQAGLLAGSLLFGRGGGFGRATSQAAKKATKATKKKGVANTKIPKKQLPKTATSSRMSMDAPVFSNVPLKEYTYSTKTKGDAMRKVKAVVRKVEDAGEEIKKAASMLKMKGKAGIQKVKKQANAAIKTAKLIRSEMKEAGIPSTIQKLKNQARAGMTTGKVIRAEKKAQKKATRRPETFSDTLSSTYRDVKKGLGLDSPGTFQAELQKKLPKKKKTNKELAKGKEIRGYTGPGKSASIGEISIRPSDIRRVPKSENIFFPGLSRQYNRLKKKPQKPSYNTGKKMSK